MGVSDEELKRVHAPVGLDLGRKDAEDIALSIAAGIVADAHHPPGVGSTRMTRDDVRATSPAGRRTAPTTRAATRHLDRWDRLGWGIWDVPEDDLHALGDVAGLDALEYGCGAASSG